MWKLRKITQVTSCYSHLNFCEIKFLVISLLKTLVFIIPICKFDIEFEQTTFRLVIQEDFLFCKFKLWKNWAKSYHFGLFWATCPAQQFFGLGLGQKKSAQGRFGPASFGPPLGLGQPWAKLVYRPGPIWAGPGPAQTHPYPEEMAGKSRWAF